MCKCYIYFNKGYNNFIVFVVGYIEFRGEGGIIV